MRDRVSVRNAADREQVKHAAREQKDREDRFLDNLRTVLALREGRELIWELLTQSSIYESVVDRQPEMTYYHAGRQDFGHRLLSNTLRADGDLYVLMEQESRTRTTREAQNAQAVQDRDKTDELMQ